MLYVRVTCVFLYRSRITVERKTLGSGNVKAVRLRLTAEEKRHERFNEVSYRSDGKSRTLPLP